MKKRYRRLGQERPKERSHYDVLLEDVRRLVCASRQQDIPMLEMRKELMGTFWKVGKCVHEHSEGATNKSRFFRESMPRLAQDLLKEFGSRFFSELNLRAMRQLYLDRKHDVSPKDIPFVELVKRHRMEETLV